MSLRDTLSGDVGDVESERRLVGAILVWPEHCAEVLAVTHPDDLGDPVAREVLRAIAAVDASREPVAVETVRAELVAAGVWHAIGGAKGLGDLVDDAAGDRAVVDVLAAQVRQWAHARALGETLRRALAETPSAARDVPGWLDATSEAVHGAVRGVRRPVTAEAIGDVVAGALEPVEALPGVPWCLPSLRPFGRLCAGQLFVLAARPAVGKSALALQQALHTAREGEPVLFVSCEMSRAEVGARALSIVAEVDGAATSRRRRYTRDEEVAVAHAQRTLRGAPLTVLDQPGATLAAVRAEARRIVARHGRIALVVLDYLQLMSPPERRKGGTREEEVSQLSRGAKILAGELGCAVLALSQLNRAADGTAPRLAHLRESGALEQDANAVIFLHSDVAPQEGDAVIGVDVVVAKNRSGPVGKVGTLFGRAITTFTEQRFDSVTEENE